jgi:outer membrane protein OmpA-like peptidoglycan-associated protein
MSIRIPLILSLSAVVALGACTDPQQLAEGEDRNRTAEGALAGGVFGAIAGLAVGDDAESRRTGAIVGAAAGAIGGAAIGNALDRQEEALRRQLGNDRIVIRNTGEALIVTMPQDILFDLDSASLRPDLRSDLRALATNLQQYPQTSVDIVGHTDSTGSDAYNDDLSARRAQAVSQVLVGSGVSPARIRAYGRGSRVPVASNATAEGRAQNRRVEIVIRPTA